MITLVFSTTTVREPSTLPLLAAVAGLFGFAARARRRHGAQRWAAERLAKK